MAPPPRRWVSQAAPTGSGGRLRSLLVRLLVLRLPFCNYAHFNSSPDSLHLNVSYMLSLRTNALMDASGRTIEMRNSPSFVVAPRSCGGNGVFTAGVCVCAAGYAGDSCTVCCFNVTLCSFAERCCCLGVCSRVYGCQQRLRPGALCTTPWRALHRDAVRLYWRHCSCIPRGMCDLCAVLILVSPCVCVCA